MGTLCPPIHTSPLWPVSSFKTYIAAVRQVKGDQTVGYGRKGVLGRDTRIAVIPVGYADGDRKSVV